VVDIGVIGFELAGAGPFPVPSPGTGVIWRNNKGRGKRECSGKFKLDPTKTFFGNKLTVSHLRFRFFVVETSLSSVCENDDVLARAATEL
jgi:hypothetical protein